ncbi:P-loop containing nucleoside triphosphate hydrolase protein [Phellopilus nigrolimitatus]|nr:P-loop containing nucleoside triphosphate hydrolase protein [Phellopilus nigrolimitatus]
MYATHLDKHAAHVGRESMESKDATSSANSSSTSIVRLDGLYSKKVVPPFDLEMALRETIKQCDSRNMRPRTLGLAFKDLSVFGVDKSLSSGCVYQLTLGSLLNPVEWAKSLIRRRHPCMRRIISGFEGVVNSGEMLLVLGRPGSGCSTFLKTLANQTDDFKHVLGDRYYDSLTPQEVKEGYRGDVIYCPEDDVHFPTLTVEQTIYFAAKARAPRRSVRSEYHDHITAVLTTIFGLRHVKDFPVGNVSQRSISGGEKRRVSICEALAARALLGCWDNSTRGLDVSTALEFGRALRIATDLTGLTAIVGMHQASETLYQLFDKVCVIGEGRMYYYGKADTAREYFQGLGYMPHSRQTTADFLISVTDPNGRLSAPSHPLPIPRTPDDFVHAFHKSRQGQENRYEMAAFWHEFVNRSSLQTGRVEKHPLRQTYTNTFGSQLYLAISRRYHIVKGGWNALLLQIILYSLQAAVVGTMYLHVPDSTASFSSRGGVIYSIVLFGVLSAMFEGSATHHERDIVDRYRKAAMYRPSIETVALIFVDIPFTVTLQTIFATIVYFLVGFQRTVGQFVIFLLIILAMTFTTKTLFRAIGAVLKRKTSGDAIHGLASLLLLSYAGFAIPKLSLVKGLWWLTWLDPLRYGVEALMVNEFHSLDLSCSSFAPRGPGYEDVSLSHQICITVGSIPGRTNVDGNRYLELTYDYSYDNLWINVGFVLAFGLFFLGCLLIFTEWNASSAGPSFVHFKRGFRVRGSGVEEKIHHFHTRRSGHNADDLNDLHYNVPLADVFTWGNLQYAISEDRKQRLLLDNISGYVAPGNLVALMGECGAGKSTLLNVLAGRCNTGDVAGELLLNGRPLPLDFASQIGFCQQIDIHTAEQTVREALLFSAKLRQPSSIPLSEKESYVESCLEMCGLEEYAEAVISSLDVEYRRRTTIGVELAAQPKLLLFLDEPTSGLDSQASLAIINLLRDLTNHGQAILCTVHQPSSELFRQFDQLLFLGKGGKTVYFGDVGSNCETLISYFERNGARPCDPSENPADWMVDVVSADNTAYIPIDWHNRWLRSPEITKLRYEIQGFKKAASHDTATDYPVRPKYMTTWAYQLYALTIRGFAVYWRSPCYLFAKLALNILAGLLIGFTFFKAQNSIQGTQDKLFAIFMVTIVCIPVAIQHQAVYMDMRRIYEIRERHSRMYSWTAFITSQLLRHGTGRSGSKPVRAPYTFLMLGIVFPTYYTTFAQATAAISPTAEVSSVLFIALFSFVGTFNGVLQPFERLGWWKWMYRASPFTYLVEGLLGQAVGNQQIQCSPVEFSIVNPPSGLTCYTYLSTFIDNFGGYVNNPEATRSCQYCPARTTDEFLEGNFNIFYAHRWRNVAIVIGASLFNVLLLYTFTYTFRIRGGLFCIGKRKRMVLH